MYTFQNLSIHIILLVLPSIHILKRKRTANTVRSFLNWSSEYEILDYKFYNAQFPLH